MKPEIGHPAPSMQLKGEWLHRSYVVRLWTVLTGAIRDGEAERYKTMKYQTGGESLLLWYPAPLADMAGMHYELLLDTN